MTSRGKGRPVFFQKLSEACAREGFDAQAMDLDAVISEEVPPGSENHAFFVLNEINFYRAKPMERFERARQALETKGFRVHSKAERLLTLGSKSAQNGFFRKRGVPMPEIVEEDTLTGSNLVFSNAETGAATASQVYAAGSTIDPTRYNTRFIDSTTYYKDTPFYVSLRALAVGKTSLATLVRASPKSNGNPNVRHKNTPRDPEMLHYFHNEISVKMQPKIDEIANKVEASMGLDFYHLDLVPETATGNLYVSEVGLKYNDGIYLGYFKSLRSTMPNKFLYTDEIWTRYARELKAQLLA